MASGYVEFEFDLPDALLRNLVSIFGKTESAPLTIANVDKVPEEQGVYQLLFEGRVVYVGKTDAEAGLHKRLARHAKKILHRRKLDPSKVSFKAVRIYVFTAINLETALINNYGGVKGLEWNGSGFGSNDPGRRRDRTVVDADNYDAIYPIDIDRELAFAVEERETADTVVARLKDALPYTFRYQTSDNGGRRPHDDFSKVELKFAPGPMTARAAINHIVASMPPGWQATSLPGYVILYKEREEYPDSEVICRS